MHFPQYDYDDMVASQHTMLVEGLHVDHLRLILGTSMGCMQSFGCGETYPSFSDALVSFACLTIITGSAPPQMPKNYPTRRLAEGYVDRALDFFGSGL
jgi:homoserine acetyltransferase